MPKTASKKPSASPEVADVAPAAERSLSIAEEILSLIHI